MHAGELLFCYCEMRIDCEREDASVCESAMQRERGDIFVVAERRSATIVDIIADAIDVGMLVDHLDCFRA